VQSYRQRVYQQKRLTVPEQRCVVERQLWLVHILCPSCTLIGEPPSEQRNDWTTPIHVVVFIYAISMHALFSGGLRMKHLIARADWP